MSKNDKGRIVGGYNFVDKNDDLTDEHGQGTHAAGTISAETRNIIAEAIEYAASKGTIVVAAEEGPAKKSLGELVEHAIITAGATAWGTLAGITGDYAALGGYQGIYHRLEMGLAGLRGR